MLILSVRRKKIDELDDFSISLDYIFIVFVVSMHE